MIKITKESEEYYYCTKCKKEIEPIQEGAPISGFTWNCPHCGLDVHFDDEVEQRERNVVYKSWLLIKETHKP